MNTILVIAIIAGPILAVQAQKIIELIKQRRDEKRRLFMTLMATRGNPLLPEHVQALNMIDIIFSVKNKILGGKKDKAVIDTYAEFRDHLYHFPREPVAKEGTDISEEDRTSYNSQMQTWTSKRSELLIELLDKMADSLGYHFDKVLLKRGSYTPRHYEDLQIYQYINMKGLSDLFIGNKSLPINIVGTPPIEITESPQKVKPEEPKQEPSEEPK